MVDRKLEILILTSTQQDLLIVSLFFSILKKRILSSQKVYIQRWIRSVLHEIICCMEKNLKRRGGETRYVMF